MSRVYCRNCSYLQKEACTHPNNLKTIHTWKEIKYEYKRFPEKINKDNDCKDFKEYKRKGYPVLVCPNNMCKRPIYFDDKTLVEALKSVNKTIVEIE